MLISQFVVEQVRNAFLKSFFVPKHRLVRRYKKRIADTHAAFEHFRYGAEPDSESFYYLRDPDDEFSQYEILDGIVREFPVTAHLPFELDQAAFDYRMQDTVNFLNRLDYIFSPDFQLLRRILQYHTLWLMANMDIVDFLDRHDLWFGYRDDLCGFIDFWRAFRSFYNLKSWVGFPFWDSRRRSFLPFERKK